MLEEVSRDIFFLNDSSSALKQDSLVRHCLDLNGPLNRKLIFGCTLRQYSIERPISLPHPPAS